MLMLMQMQCNYGATHLRCYNISSFWMQGVTLCAYTFLNCIFGYLHQFNCLCCLMKYRVVLLLKFIFLFAFYSCYRTFDARSTLQYKVLSVI
jgi:hypothetical protein